MDNQRQSKLIESVTGVVLAGGRSSRMGTDKARLRLQERTLVDWSVAALNQCFVQTMVIANDPGIHPSGIPDDEPGQGPLGGIATALRHATTPGVFVVACDMPFLNVDLIREMAGALPGWEAVAVRGEQLHAAYSRSVLPAIAKQIGVGDRSVHGLLGQLRVRWFSEAELARFPNARRSFFNVNTPADFEQARHLFEERKHYGSQNR